MVQERVEIRKNNSVHTMTARTNHWRIEFNSRFLWWELYNGKSRLGHFEDKEDAEYKLDQLRFGAIHE